MTYEMNPHLSRQKTQRVDAIETLAALRGVQPPAYAATDGLGLSALSIGDKWGFYDGDVTDPVYDLLIDWYGRIPSRIGSWWKPVLWTLVHEHLIPELTPRMDVPLPRLHYMYGTMHNPVRFADDTAVDPAILPDLTVHVPWLRVLAHCVVEIDERVEAERA